MILAVVVKNMLIDWTTRIGVTSAPSVTRSKRIGLASSLADVDSSDTRVVLHIYALRRTSPIRGPVVV